MSLALLGRFLLANWQLVLIAILIATVGVQGWRLDNCKKEASEYRTQAEAREKALGETIAVQNRAVAALETESRNRIAKASESLKREAKNSQAARDEAERLRRLAKDRQPAGLCPAADAIAEIRKGLR